MAIRLRRTGGRAQWRRSGGIPAPGRFGAVGELQDVVVLEVEGHRTGGAVDLDNLRQQFVKLSLPVQDYRMSSIPDLDTNHDSSSPIPEGRSSCEQYRRKHHWRDHRAGPVVPVSAGQPGCRAGPDRAPRGRQLPPRPPGVVHRPCSRRRRVGDRGLHRPAAGYGAVAGPSGRPLHLDHPQRRWRHVRADRRAVGGARRDRTRPVPGLPEPTRGVHRDHHRDRGGVRRSAPIGGWTRSGT